jgi:polysaccharide export outer membrane protein
MAQHRPKSKSSRNIDFGRFVQSRIMRLLDRIPSSCWHASAVLALVAVLAGCGTSAPPPAGQPQTSASNGLTDPLRISDRIKIDITGTPETIDPSEQEIKEDGTINVQGIGRIQAAGMTPGQLEKSIQAALVPSYYAHCNVTVSPTGRFFYVGGEVSPNGSGGRIIFSGPITVTRAIDSAGGFSPFANRRKVRLTRVDGTIFIVNCRKAILHPELDLSVYPGDRIYVPRRF